MNPNIKRKECPKCGEVMAYDNNNGKPEYRCWNCHGNSVDQFMAAKHPNVISDKHLRDIHSSCLNPTSELEKLREDRDALRQELENERMRLAACSVAALGGALNPDGMYTSASMKDVIDLYDKYMKAREELDNGHAFLSALGVPNVDIQSASHAVFLPLRERLHTCHTWLAELQSIRQEKPFGLGSAKL